MRWFWVDRVTEFVSGSHARGIKNIALDAEVIDQYLPGYPMFPPTLIIEGLAQLGGILVSEKFDFRKRVVLAKVGKAVYHQPAIGGDQLEYRVQIDAVQPHGATVICTSHCGETLQAEIDLMFAFLEEGHLVDGPLFEPGDMRQMLRQMKLFHVAVDADGNPLAESENL